MKKITEEQKQERDELFLKTLANLQQKHNAYWIKTTHVREAFFGKVDIKNGPKLNERMNIYNRDLARVRSLYKNLEKRKKLKVTKHKPDGKGLACIYLHTKYTAVKPEPAFRKWVREKMMVVN